jgi:hypothetical protein
MRYRDQTFYESNRHGRGNKLCPITFEYHIRAAILLLYWCHKLCDRRSALFSVFVSSRSISIIFFVLSANAKIRRKFYWLALSSVRGKRAQCDIFGHNLISYDNAGKRKSHRLLPLPTHSSRLLNRISSLSALCDKRPPFFHPLPCSAER